MHAIKNTIIDGVFSGWLIICSFNNRNELIKKQPLQPLRTTRKAIKLTIACYTPAIAISPAQQLPSRLLLLLASAAKKQKIIRYVQQKVPPQIEPNVSEQVKSIAVSNDEPA